jgi:CRISPR-associated protein Cmr3
VKAISVHGPLLAELDANGAPVGCFAPAPADALLIDNAAGELDRWLMAPLEKPAGATTDLENVPVNGAPLQPELLLVGPPRPEFRKAARRPPAFWNWQQFEEWLRAPADGSLAAADLGIDGPPRDRRMHVGIDPGKLTGLDGALFLTGGLSFWHNAERESPRLSGARRLGLVVDVAGLGDLSIDTGFGPLGGERRLMHWRPGGDGAALPPPPADLRQQIITDRRCRVILLTPAYFERGWWPRFLTEPRAGVAARLVAAAIGKPRTVSGWNLEVKQPRESQRLAPAGSVFYLELTGDGDVGAWFDQTWMQPMSDAAERRAAGFGLAAIGIYSGPRPMSIEEEPHA